ncbi:hypothetical protein [Chitinivorax sp. B]|uniref:hypothetical protein n=1 Tax=Chitinivorax sp. B TaxID=2502235 RepID=UPI0010F72BBB|nr:hypothetical protein [Chitinivorax sp. B]
MNRCQPRTMLTLVMLTGTLLSMPAWCAPPPWAPAHGHRAKERKYIYYPAREIYFEPARRLWFWLDGGSWQFGARLPISIGSKPSGGVSVLLATDRPYEAHDYVVTYYGKGNKAHKPKKEKKDKHSKHD